jgi:hypothetical protein
LASGPQEDWEPPCHASFQGEGVQARARAASQRQEGEFHGVNPAHQKQDSRPSLGLRTICKHALRLGAALVGAGGVATTRAWPSFVLKIRIESSTCCPYHSSAMCTPIRPTHCCTLLLQSAAAHAARIQIRRTRCRVRPHRLATAVACLPNT